MGSGEDGNELILARYGEDSFALIRSQLEEQFEQCEQTLNENAFDPNLERVSTVAPVANTASCLVADAEQKVEEAQLPERNAQAERRASIRQSMRGGTLEFVKEVASEIEVATDSNKQDFSDTGP